jgi:site-specific DNA recombinase
VRAALCQKRREPQRAHGAMARKARACQVTGGRVYGYRNAEVLGADGRRAHVVLEIEPAEAAVVRRIFELYRDGHGVVRIARRLNAERVAPPRRAAHGWAHTAVREMLRRDLYRGVLVWGRRETIERGGTSRQRLRPEAAWVRRDAPDLAIIRPDLWAAVEARRAASAATFARRAGRAHAAAIRARVDQASPYLLAGLAACAECGGAIIAIRRGPVRGRRPVYGCSYHYKRGPTVCANRVQVPVAAVDDVVLAAIAARRDADLIAEAVDMAFAPLRAGATTEGARRADLERALAGVAERERRLADAIAEGGALDALVDRLEAEQAQKRALEADLDALGRQTAARSLDAGRLRRALAARAADVRGLLGRQRAQARRMLQTLLVGKLTPMGEGGRPGYLFAGRGSYGVLAAGSDWTPGVVAPTGLATPCGLPVRGIVQRRTA